MNGLKLALRQWLKNPGFTAPDAPQRCLPDRVEFRPCRARKPGHPGWCCYGGRAVAVLTLALLFVGHVFADFALRHVEIAPPALESRVPQSAAQGGFLAPQAISTVAALTLTWLMPITAFSIRPIRHIFIDLSPESLIQTQQLMKTEAVISLTLLLLVSTSQAQLVWQVGRDDNDWPLTGTAGGPDANFVQENGAISPLPGSPLSTPVPQGADNDYYFAGTYTTVIDGNGVYTPIGEVAANENSAERAFAAADNDLRYHFNLPGTLGPSDLLWITFDPLNLDDQAINPDPRYGVEVYFNGVLVGPQVIVRAGQLDTDIATAQFTLASVNAQTGPGADNIVSLRGINYNAEGGGNWMGVDYVQLDAVPEPSSVALMLFFGALGIVPFLRRRRS